MHLQKKNLQVTEIQPAKFRWDINSTSPTKCSGQYEETLLLLHLIKMIGCTKMNFIQISNKFIILAPKAVIMIIYYRSVT
jgi:hypothetical protein